MFDKMILFKPTNTSEIGFRLDQVVKFHTNYDGYLQIFLGGVDEPIKVSHDETLINMLYMLLCGAFDGLIKDREERVFRLDDLFDEFMQLEEDRSNGVY